VEAGARRGPGLVHKGSFKVDEVNHSGPPDQIRIRARAADFTSAIRNRREQSWANTTLGAVLQDIAGRNALALRIAPDLAAIALPRSTRAARATPPSCAASAARTTPSPPSRPAP
jgi:phage protein D